MPALPGAASQPPATSLQASSPPPPPASHLGPRAPQSTPGFQAIPSTYHAQESSLAPGAIAGIVLGSVGAFLLLLALLYSCTGWTPVFLPWSPAGPRRTVVVEDDARHKHHRRHKHRRRRSSRIRTETEMYEVRRTASRARPVSRPVQVPMPPPPMMPGVRVTQTTTRHGPSRVARDDVTETDFTEDEIVVMEERPPRHRSSGRSSRRDSRRYSRGP